MVAILYSPRVLRLALIVTQTLLALGCMEPIEYERVCETHWGTTVYFQPGAPAELTCESLEAHESATIQAFVKYELPVQRLLERLPFTRVIVRSWDDPPMVNGERVGGWTQSEWSLIITQCDYSWEGTALAHEYAHLSEDGEARRGGWESQWANPYKDHEGWCANNVWKAVGEARGQDWGGSSCKDGKPSPEQLR